MSARLLSRELSRGSGAGSEEGSHCGSESECGSLSGGSRGSSRRLQQESYQSSQKTRVRHGVNVLRLQEWRGEHRRGRMDEEDSKQEVALAKMKKRVNATSMVVRLQSWARMLACRHSFLVVRGQKSHFKWVFFYAWWAYMRAEVLFRRSLLLRPLREWANEASESRRLSALALSIFKKAVNRSKLTPQAVMAFFSKNDSWSGKITEQEMNMVRRLILKKLYAAWVLEAKKLRIRRFKASQIITRMLRRTYGNLSQKERLILSLHLWHRLAAVSAADKKGESQPYFNTPYIKEWPVVLQNLTVKKIKKIRAQESARQLLKMRAFKAWCKAVDADNTPDNDDSQALAEAHFVERLMQRVFDEWNGLTRERGRNLRRREKCFIAWRAWAPVHRRLSAAEKIITNWDQQAKKAANFGKWSSAMHGIVASRTFSLRVLRQKIFSTPILVLCYTIQGRDAHLMLLDCWRRWKCYWTKRRNWLRARWKFRITWIHERCASLFQAWKDYVEQEKIRREEKKAIADMGLTAHRRKAVVRAATLTDFMKSSEKESDKVENDVPEGFAGKSLLAKCFAVMNDGSESKLDTLPTQREFLTMMKCFWGRPKVPRAGVVPSTKGENESETSSITHIPELVPVNDREVDQDTEVHTAMAALDLKKLAQCILNKDEVLPEHIERFSVGLGDKYVPLVSMLLARCTPYIAKRILLGDLKDQVFKCNSPLMAVLIGTHVTRWTSVQLTIREVKSATDDLVIAPKSGGPFQMVFIVRCLTLVLLKQRCRDLINTCKLDPTKKGGYTEEEGVALVLRRQKLQKLWRTEEVMRDLLGVSPDPVAEAEKEQLKALYAEYYVGKVEQFVAVKVKERAVDPWIFNLDLCSLLREYAHLTGSLADAAKDMRQPLLERDDRLLKNGLLKQARRDYQELSAYTKSLRPPVRKRQKMGAKQKKTSPKKKKKQKKKNIEDEDDIDEDAQLMADELDEMEESEIREDDNQNALDTFADESNNDTDDETSTGMDSGVLTTDVDPTSEKKESENKGENDDEGLLLTELTYSDPASQLSFSGCVFELKNGVVMESYWPTFPKPAPVLPPNRSGKYSESARAILKAQAFRDDSNANIAERMVDNSLNTIVRIVSLLEQLGLPNLSVRQTSDYCRDKSGIATDKSTQRRTYTSPTTMVNIGANFVEAIHFKPYRLMQIKQWKTWWPRKWWQHERLSLSIEQELEQVHALTNRAQKELNKVQVRYKEIDKEVNDHTKYMNQMRRRMVAIGGKTKEHNHEANNQKTALRRLVDTHQITHKKKDRKLNTHIALLAKAKISMEEKKYEDVCSLLLDSTADDESVTSQQEILSNIRDSESTDGEIQKEQNLAFRGVAKELITKNEAILVKLTEALHTHDVKLKKTEAEFDAYCTQTNRVNSLLSHMAKEKFSSTLEVQDLTVKHMSDLKTLKASEKAYQKEITSLNRYCDELMAYSDHLVCVKQKEDVPSSPVDKDKIKPHIGKAGRSASSLTPSSPNRQVISKQNTVALDTDENGRVRSPVLIDGDTQLGMTAGEFSPPAPEGQGNGKKTVDFSLNEGDDDHLSPPIHTVNSKAIDFLSGRKGGSKHRMSLVDFSKKISDEDKFSLNRKHLSPTAAGTMAGDLKTAEKEVKISDDMARSIRVEITDEYWNILEMMESQGEKVRKPQDEDSSMSSSVTVESASITNATNNISEDLMFFDEEDLQEFPYLNRKLSRTARMYHRVKQRCLLEDSDSTGYTAWPEIIEEELKLEMAEVLKEEAEIQAKNMHVARKRDAIYEINKRKGIIKRTIRQHAKKNIADTTYSSIDPFSGEKRDIDKDNTLPDPMGDQIEKVDDDQWKSTIKFKQASISMSANDSSNQPVAPKSKRSSRSAVKDLDRQNSVSKVRQRAATTTRRKAVVKVVLMDPFAAAGSKINERMHIIAKDEVVQPLDIDESDKFATLQPDQIEWRREMGDIKYDLSDLEEPRRVASSPQEAREYRERLKLEKEVKRREEEERLAQEELEAQEEERLRQLEGAIIEEYASDLSIDELNEQTESEEATQTNSEDENETESDGKVDFDTLFANGLIDEDEYDRLKIVRAAEEQRREEEAKEEEIRLEAERMMKRKEKEAKRAARLKEGAEALEKGEERKAIKLQDEDQAQTVTAMINAAAAARNAAESFTIYDKKELEEIRLNQLKKEHQRATIVKQGLAKERSKKVVTSDINVDRIHLEAKIKQTEALSNPDDVGPDLEKDNFWGGGVDLGTGPQIYQSDEDSLTKSLLSMEASDTFQQQEEAPPVMSDDVDNHPHSYENSDVVDVSLPKKSLNDYDSVVSRLPIVVNTNEEHEQPHFSDEELRIVSTIDTSPVLSVLRPDVSESQKSEDVGDGNSPGSRSVCSGVSELSHDSASCSRRRTLSGQDKFDKQEEQSRLDIAAEQFLPEYFENDDHSLLSIGSKTSQMQHDNTDSDEEPMEGHALLMKNDEWKIVPHRRAVMSPEVGLKPRSAQGGVIFGTKIIPSFDEQKMLKREERAVRAHARMLERSLSRSPSPSRRPIVQEDKAGGKWYETVPPSPVKKVHVKTSPHKVKQPIEVVGSNCREHDVERLELHTASDEEAPAAVYDPKRWQNKFFTGQGVAELVPPINDSLTYSGQPSHDSNAPRKNSRVHFQEVPKNDQNDPGQSSRKVPLLNNVRPAPTPPPENTLHDFIKKEMLQDDCEEQAPMTEYQIKAYPPGNNYASSSRSNSIDSGQGRYLSTIPQKKSIDLETEEYEMTPSAREFLTSEEGIRKRSLQWLEEKARVAAAKERQQVEELCGNRVDNCADNIVRILLEDTAQNAYHEENVLQGRVRVHNLDRGKQTIYLKNMAEERKAGLVPVSMKETEQVRGEYSEIIPHNGTVEGQSVISAFQNSHPSKLSDHHGEDEKKENEPMSDVIDPTPEEIEQEKLQNESIQSLRSEDAFAYLNSYSEPIMKTVDAGCEMSINSSQKRELSSRGVTPKEKFENMQSHSILPKSESSPRLQGPDNSLTPQVIGLARDSLSKQLHKKSQKSTKRKLSKPSVSKSVENMNLQNFDFAFSSQHPSSQENVLTQYSTEVTGNGRQKPFQQRMEVSSSAPLFPPISTSRPNSNEFGSEANLLANRLLESKEDTQRSSPLGKGKSYDDAGLYVSYSSVPSMNRPNNRPQPLGKGPPAVGKNSKGGKSGMGAMMKPVGSGTPVLAGLRKLSSSSSTSSQSQQDAPNHDSDDIVLAAYAAAMGVSWDPSKPSNQQNPENRVAINDLLASIEKSRINAPLFSQEDTPMGNLIPNNVNDGSMGSVGSLGSIGSYPELFTPQRDPLDPRSSADVKVRMSSDFDFEGDDEEQEPSGVMVVNVNRSKSTHNVLEDSNEEQGSRGKDDDQLEASVEEGDDVDEEEVLEEQLRALLHEKRMSKKRGKNNVSDAAVVVKKTTKVGNRQHFGTKSTSSIPKLNQVDDISTFPALVVGAAKLPKRKSNKSRKSNSDQNCDESTALSLNSSHRGDAHSTARSQDSGKSGRSTVNSYRSDASRKSFENFTPTAAVLLAKYAPANNPQLAARMTLQSVSDGKRKSRRSSVKKTLSTLESNEMGLDASSLLERTMADYDE